MLEYPSGMYSYILNVTRIFVSPFSSVFETAGSRGDRSCGQAGNTWNEGSRRFPDIRPERPVPSTAKEASERSWDDRGGGVEVCRSAGPNYREHWSPGEGRAR